MPRPKAPSPSVARIASVGCGASATDDAGVEEIVEPSPELQAVVGRFGEARTAELKGIPGAHQLFSLVWRDAEG